ncbi:Ferric/cupric reductase transmembrane component 2 [Cytospora mali]|uniref:Ferric/cupric reductase transmembrane component 2 n=1 Tax=Cytospora mali TaxID=578113 RepID=A0A194UUI6_CYTMA|nr:Ferric/cupric reductase transmembrane component 2 [Valsa mali var. pyri (nom. inval.)]
MASRFAARTRVNQQQLRYYAAGICGLVGIFIIFHWVRYVFNKPALRRTAITHPFRVISRNVRNLLVRKVPWFPSSGHALLFMAYLAINLALTFTNIEIVYANIANRCGWMLSANFALVVFLALKNTPLAVLSAYSYERLNGLHQIAGYTSFVYLVLHSSMYTSYFIAHDRIEVLQGASVTAGIIAGFAFLGVTFSAVVIRKIWYEAFYIIHIACFIIAIICASYHQPGIEAGVIIIFGLIAGMWIADRMLRAMRLMYGAVNNEATLEPLPDGGTRITLAKRPYRVVPGKHCFIWIPKIRMFESHPFTVVASEPVEFVVNAYDGFTGELHKHALANPGARLKASADGPYGTFPDPMEFDKVILIAGGSGASFTFGLAVNLLERMGPESTKNITFIWAVKHHDHFNWFTDHLETLRTHEHSPKVNVELYATKAPNTTRPDEQRHGSVMMTDRLIHRGRTSESTIDSPTGDEKALERGITTNSSSTTTTTAAAAAGGGPEKPTPAARGHNNTTARRMTSDESMATTYNPADGRRRPSHDVKAGRPDTAALIRGAVSSTPSHQRVLVAACGPDGLMRVVRDTTASLIRGDGPGVELHCEQFGW